MLHCSGISLQNHLFLNTTCILLSKEHQISYHKRLLRFMLIFTQKHIQYFHTNTFTKRLRMLFHTHSRSDTAIHRRKLTFFRCHSAVGGECAIIVYSYLPSGQDFNSHLKSGVSYIVNFGGPVHFCEQKKHLLSEKRFLLHENKIVGV